jgi:hypothetical protein
MVNWDWKGLLTKWSQDLTVRYAALTLTTAVVFSTITACLNPTIQIENVRALLTTLAAAEASVLAIVFSVTVVALQLVVTRYSARLTSLFVKEPLFQTTFALFVGAIGLNLLTIYLLPTQSGRLVNAAVGITFGIAAVSTVALYRFIRLMIQRSSPDELISVLTERELAPTEYLPESVEDFKEIDVHPIRRLYTTISRAIELGEYQTAAQGIDGLRTVLIQTFEYLDTEYSEEEAAQYATDVSSEILIEYVPPILEQAYTHDQFDLVSNTVDDVEEIALDGLDRGFSDVTEDAAEGLGDAFDAAPLTWDGNRLRAPVTETLVELTKVTASESDYWTFRSVFRQLNLQMTVLLRRRPDSNVTDRLIGDYYRHDSIDIFEALVDRYGPEVLDQEINWISPTEGRTSTLPDAARPLRHFWRKYASFTQTVLRYRVSEEEYPFADGSIKEGWNLAAECAADAEVDELATLCCTTMIQLAYEVDQLGDGGLGLWANNLGLLRLDYDPAIVDRAFTLLKAGERPESGNISVHAPMSDDADGGFFTRFFSSDKEEQSFDEWVVKFEEQVDERTEYLRKRH